MKYIWPIVYAIIGVCLLLVGGLGGYVLFATQPTQPPEVVYSTPQVIEIPVEVPVEVEVIRTVEVERIITATPAPVVAEPLQITEEVPPEPVAAAPDCVDSARIERQPISDIQAGAIKYGTIKRLTWILENTGTCVWEGYTWESTEDPLVLPVPYTPPGGTAIIQHDIVAKEPLSLRMFLMAPARAGLMGLSNANSTDQGAIYVMEVWRKLNYAPSGSYTQQVCGPAG